MPAWINCFEVSLLGITALAVEGGDMPAPDTSASQPETIHTPDEMTVSPEEPPLQSEEQSGTETPSAAVNSRAMVRCFMYVPPHIHLPPRHSGADRCVSWSALAPETTGSADGCLLDRINNSAVC